MIKVTDSTSILGHCCSLAEQGPTAATLLLAEGVNPKIVSEMLGHATVSLTLDVYFHVTPTLQAEAVATMQAVLAGRPL